MMKRGFLFRASLCIFACGITLYMTIDKNNHLTAMQLAIPLLEKEVKALQKQNVRLQYQIDQFESPLHLMEFLRKPEYSHLKYPYIKDILILPSNADRVKKP